MARTTKASTPRAKGDRTYAALLRGINVGGANKLPMRDLVAIFAEAGCSDVTTYIQSGNVVFNASPGVAKRLPDLVPAGIARAFAYQVPVVLRSVNELRGISRSNPFIEAGEDPAMLHVAFLASSPRKAGVSTLDPNRSPPDAFTMRGREIYLCLPNGVARSKLTNQYFDARLGTTSTLRNWRTVLKLLELAEGVAST